MELWGRKVSAAVKPSLFARTAVVCVPFICPDKQNIVNYYLVILLYSVLIMTAGSSYGAVFCLIYLSSCGVDVVEAKCSQFLQRVDAVINFTML
jgi:hypothetical protein